MTFSKTFSKPLSTTVSETSSGMLSRRAFIAGSTCLAGSLSLPFKAMAQTAPAIRYEANSPQGQQMLKSYAVAIKKMLALPTDHPHNWFRIAFIHYMDCPHGNWWFYVWHRGYIGYVEQIIRHYSGNPSFALPYWDWTASPQMPDMMFEGVLTPTDSAYGEMTRDIDTFTQRMQPALQRYWQSLNSAQREQLKRRGYQTFDQLWNGVTGYDPESGQYIPGNAAFATMPRSRYLSRANPNLDAKTAHACSPQVVVPGLKPTRFYDGDNMVNSFCSSKTNSHNHHTGGTTFSVLEGQPHNQVHNNIGGVPTWNPGPYGNMTNFLSPVDPIFFLHHANMDRLWEVWERKQQVIQEPTLPTDPVELRQLKEEPFLFFFNAQGDPILNGKAGDYLSTSAFNYVYAPGFIDPAMADKVTRNAAKIQGTIQGDKANVTLQQAPGKTLFAVITFQRSADPSAPRQFDITLNAPEGKMRLTPEDPHFAGIISLFGPAHGKAHDVTFIVPIPQHNQVIQQLQQLKGNQSLQLQFDLTHDQNTAPAIKALHIQAL